MRSKPQETVHGELLPRFLMLLIIEKTKTIWAKNIWVEAFLNKILSAPGILLRKLRFCQIMSFGIFIIWDYPLST